MRKKGRVARGRVYELIRAALHNPSTADKIPRPYNSPFRDRSPERSAYSNPAKLGSRGIYTQRYKING